MNVVVIVVAAYVAVVSATFCLVFHLRTSGTWRLNDAGRWLMISRLSVALLGVLAVLNRAVGDWPRRDVVSLVLFALFALQITWPLLQLVRPRTVTVPSHQPSEDQRVET